ncbi:hypothetical protein GQ600_15135 [Phytophthora cactorum]|nr:hypothetical protein GQ600_15135 [Phytophthora cactorum]
MQRPTSVEAVDSLHGPCSVQLALQNLHKQPQLFECRCWQRARSIEKLVRSPRERPASRDTIGEYIGWQSETNWTVLAQADGSSTTDASTRNSRPPRPSPLPEPEPVSSVWEQAAGQHHDAPMQFPKKKKKSYSTSNMKRFAPTSSRRKLEAFRSTQLVLWRRRYFEGILRWEAALRMIFVDFPKLAFRHIESGRTIVSFFFVYVMLQALAILWGFLFNVGAVLGENMSTIITMPFTQAICVLVVTCRSWALYCLSDVQRGSSRGSRCRTSRLFDVSLPASAAHKQLFSQLPCPC